MKTLKELLDERSVLMNRANTESKAGEAEKRDLTSDEFKKWGDTMDEVRSLDNLIAQKRSLEDFARMRAVSIGSGEDGNRDDSPGDRRDLGGFNLLRALNMKLNNRALDGIEAEVETIGEEAAKRDNIELSGGNSLVVMDNLLSSRSLSKRAQTVTGQTANPGDQGGVLVREEVLGVLEVLQANTFLSEVGARFITGLTGNVKIPVQDTTPVIQELTEIEQMTDTEILFSSIGLTPLRRGTTVPISRQTLIQASIDMQNFVVSAIGEALAQKMNAEAIIALLSIITSGNGNLLALGTNGALPDYNDIVDLEALVEGFNHKQGTPKYLTNTKVKAILKTTQKFASTNGDPVWDRDGLNGYPAVISNIVPSNLVKGTSGSTLSPVIYGNFANWIVGQWGGTEYIIDPYSAKRRGEIEVTVNAFWNQRAARVKAFAGIKDAITVRP